MSAPSGDACFEDAAAMDSMATQLLGSPKRLRAVPREEDELSTSAGSSSDTETSGNEDQPLNLAKGADNAYLPTTGLLDLILVYLRCSRRNTTSAQASRRSQDARADTRKVRRRKESSVACLECQLKYNVGDSDQADKAIVAAPDAQFNGLLAPLPGLPFTLDQLSLVGFVPPPGLPPPPGLEFLMSRYQVDVLDDGAAFDLTRPSAAIASQNFNPVAFRKELVDILRDLNSDRNTGRAVQRVRAQHVPEESHAAEFVDILTRALETKNGMNRRSMIAFCAGLAAGDPSAFDRKHCAEGLKNFFQEVYPELCVEVPKLPALVATELLPTLKAVLPTVDLRKYCTPKFKMR